MFEVLKPDKSLNLSITGLPGSSEEITILVKVAVRRCLNLRTTDGAGYPSVKQKKSSLHHRYYNLAY